MASARSIQVEDRAELSEVYDRLRRAQAPVFEEGATTCCYAKGEKSWIADPQGVQWETFLTTGESTTYGQDPIVKAVVPEAACCAMTSTETVAPRKSNACC